MKGRNLSDERARGQEDLTEMDIRTKLITSAILGPDGSKWDSMTQVTAST